MKKNMVLSILSIVLAVSMLTMTGCGGGGGSTPSSASSADMSALANLLGGGGNTGSASTESSSMSLTFAGDGADTGSAAGTGTQPAASGLDESTMKVIEDFEGDWYGMVRINHAYDGYSAHEDAEMYATARFSFDEQGEVTAYFCASVSPLASNFLNVTARTSPQIESVVVNFDFFEGHTKDDAYFRIDRGLLNTTANIINDDGDEMDISMVFRRIGDEWTENERTVYWKYAAEYAHLAVGETAETLAAAWCDDEYPKPVPALSNIAGGGTGAAPAGGTQNAGQQGGGTDFASAGPAGNAVMDYENKGVIFFNYDDSVFTFRNSVFDGLETPYEDGNVRITFHAEYEDGLEARHKWLDDYSDQPEYRSEETTIAGLPARVVHLIDSTMFNEPYMYVLIDLRGTQEKYEDIFITVKGNSFEDIDADRVYAIINSIHFEP